MSEYMYSVGFALDGSLVEKIETSKMMVGVVAVLMAVILMAGRYMNNGGN